eukprot:COSAG02_NODE_20945_length_808_cov_61.461213_2_plen_84_part_01
MYCLFLSKQGFLAIGLNLRGWVGFVGSMENSLCISISSARSVDPLRKLQATPRSATPLGRYVVFMAAFEPLQRRSAGFHRPDIV